MVIIFHSGFDLRILEMKKEDEKPGGCLVDRGKGMRLGCVRTLLSPMSVCLAFS
jgi:hypothetical protein